MPLISQSLISKSVISKSLLDPWNVARLVEQMKIAVSLRYRPNGTGTPVRVNIDSPLVAFWRAAREWDATMRVRNRWIPDDGPRARVESRSRQQFADWQVAESTLSQIARSGRIEILSEASPQSMLRSRLTQPCQVAGTAGAAPVTPWMIEWLGSPVRSAKSNAVDRFAAKVAASEIRRMPWESLLVMASRHYQNQERLLVYRRIAGLEKNRADFVNNCSKALFVETAPGALWNVYDFDLEERAMKCYLKGFEIVRKQNLSLAELKEFVAGEEFAVIHLSGLDGVQGLQILQEEVQEARAATDEPVKAAPGIYFRAENGQPVVESPEKVADALCAGKKKPLLVTFNIYNSSAQMAAQTVMKGAAAAIGFQDYIDDTVADIFFANLYRSWSEKQRTALLDAFDVAVTELNPYIERVRGSGVTLWTSENLLEDPHALCLPAPSEKKGSKKRTVKPAVEIECAIEPYPSLNYSVLHNGKKKMFETFKIFKFGGGEKTDVRVEVVLNVAGHNFMFRQSYQMKHHILDLTDKIAIGLTSALSRSLRESVRTTIYARVTIGPDDERYCETFDVSLLAVDEWRDDAQSGVFLPSFVLPRDPVIADVIAKAQGYLMAIADDAAQGFDGYQSCDPDLDPVEALEPQTRAIWYALQHDYAVKYINPPPTFTEFSQRLRTPSEILKGGRGTCIDLALLLAACFEEIGLLPVVFLLKGHAFAGYWTTEEDQEKFKTTKRDPTAGLDDQTFVSKFEKDPLALAAENVLAPVEWSYDSQRLEEIRTALEEGRLVAVEATYLTNGGSFSSACEVGASNLDNADEFDSMLDIKLARDKDVTPLPIVAGEGA